MGFQVALECGNAFANMAHVVPDSHRNLCMSLFLESLWLLACQQLLTTNGFSKVVESFVTVNRQQCTE